jgi:hypothetical protein
VTVQASKQAGIGHEPVLPVGIAGLRRHNGAMWSQPGFMPLAVITASAGYGADFRRDVRKFTKLAFSLPPSRDKFRSTPGKHRSGR